jgi:hypothetical protein
MIGYPPIREGAFCRKINGGILLKTVYLFGRAKRQNLVLPESLCPLRLPLRGQTFEIVRSPKLDPLSNYYLIVFMPLKRFLICAPSMS